MPVSPGSGFSPYDPVTTILNAARFRLNDKLSSLYPHSGKILDETMASTQQATNNAWRAMQTDLSGLGVERFKGEVLIQNVPPTTNFDPASHQSISWTEFFDGTNYQTTPVLPSDLLIPLYMSERWAGTNFPFPPADEPNMRNKVDGLDHFWKNNALYNRQWEWREEKINVPGCIRSMDWLIGFRKYLQDFVDVATQRWWTLPVPLIRCQDPFAWHICAEFCFARAADGDSQEQMLAVAQECKALADAATKQYANDTAMKNQRTNVRRVPYGRGFRSSGRGMGGFGFGY